MALIDFFLPQYDFREIHRCEIAASPHQVLDIASRLPAESTPFFRRMIALRELPSRLSGGALASAPPFSLDNFDVLAHQPDEERVLGLIGRFWRADFGLQPQTDSESWRQFHQPGVAKLALNFLATPLANGKTLLTTETRVSCPDRLTRLKFTPYWLLIRPVSGLIRRQHLAAIRRQCESPSTG